MDRRSVAHFEILERLGEGGMGVVYRARDRVLEREVALKLIRSDRAGDRESRHRFLSEARAAAVLAHPGIATVFEAGETEAEPGLSPTLYIAEELVEGETLAERLARDPPTVEEVVQLGIQMAEALGEAHDRGVVHRDIKPSNVMLSSSGRIKILDFGLAKRTTWPTTPGPDLSEVNTRVQTLAGVVVGTPAYMAPEQITGETADARADVYAAGCVLYELLARRPPFGGGSTAEVLRKRLTEEPEALAEIRPDVPEGLARVVDRALEREPGRRPASGHELAEALRALDAETTLTVHRPATPRRSRRVGGLTASAVAAVTVGLLVWQGAERLGRPAFAFGERDFVLVADVVNETGEPVFDAALKGALETDLRQSRYVNVLDESRIRSTLRMMRVEPGARLDQAVSRDLCRRAGAKALIVPTILRAGEAYQLRAAIVEPTTGRVVDQVQVTARGREAVLLSSIDALTRELRHRLGESLASIDLTDPPFVQYTTSSLEALEQMELGRHAWATADFAGAAQAFRAALKLDPRFAVARAQLGLVLIQFLDQPDEGRRMLTRALEDSDEVSQREHLHLEAVHKQYVTEDFDGALEDYRVMAGLYPDLMNPHNNAGMIFQKLGRYEDARAMFEHAHDVDPRSTLPLWNLWKLHIQRLGNPLAAEATARRLMAVMPQEAWPVHALSWSFVAQRRFDEAEDQVRATLALDPSHPLAGPNLGHLLLRRGATEEAVEAYREAQARQFFVDDPHGILCLGIALRDSGREREARETLLTEVERVQEQWRTTPPDAGDKAMLASLWAVAGRTPDARRLLEDLGNDTPRSADVHGWLAKAHALLGHRGRAMAHLEAASAAGYDDPYFLLIDPPLAAVRDDPVLERLAPHGPRSSSADTAE